MKQISFLLCIALISSTSILSASSNALVIAPMEPAAFPTRSNDSTTEPFAESPNRRDLRAVTPRDLRAVVPRDLTAVTIPEGSTATPEVEGRRPSSNLGELQQSNLTFRDVAEDGCCNRGSPPYNLLIRSIQVAVLAGWSIFILWLQEQFRSPDTFKCICDNVTAAVANGTAP